MRFFPHGLYHDSGYEPWPDGVDRLVTAVKANGLTDIFAGNQHPVSHAALWLRAANQGVRVIVSPVGRTVANQASGIEDIWYQTYTDAQRTTPNAEALVASAIGPYAANGAVVGYCYKDDCSDSNGSDEASSKVQVAMEGAARGYLVSPMVTTGRATKTIGAHGALFTYTYPCGYINAGGSVVPAPEGDFHKGGYSVDRSVDFVDRLDELLAAALPGAAVLVTLQAHATTSAGNPLSALRYPTPREITAQAWQAVACGAKGLYWFIWGSEQGWDGLESPNSAPRLAAIAGVAARLNRYVGGDGRQIKDVLASLDRVPPAEWLAYAETTTGYPYNGYAGPLYRTLREWGNGGRQYLVACNRLTASASVRLVHRLQSGYFVNLETGARTLSGQSATLGPLDGGIWRFDP